MTPLPGGKVMGPSEPVLTGSFIFAFGWRSRAASLIHAAEDELKVRFDKV